jgi:hypothetical protein
MDCWLQIRTRAHLIICGVAGSCNLYASPQRISFMECRPCSFYVPHTKDFQGNTDTPIGSVLPQDKALSMQYGNSWEVFQAVGNQ